MPIKKASGNPSPEAKGAMKKLCTTDLTKKHALNPITKIGNNTI